MALTISLPLDDQQHAFVRQIADEINPEMTDEEIAAFLARKCMVAVRDWLVGELERIEQPKVEQAQREVRKQLKSARSNAQLLFREGA